MHMATQRHEKVTYYILLWLYTNLMKSSISLFASALTNDMLNIDISPVL